MVSCPTHTKNLEWYLLHKFIFQFLQGIIHLLTSKKTNDSRTYQHLYGMRMINTLSQEVAWLHKDTTMFHVQKSMKQSQETTGPQVIFSPEFLKFFRRNTFTKGQLILKCPFGVFKSKHLIFFKEFLP